jgi:hypothetical protein
MQDKEIEKMGTKKTEKTGEKEEKKGRIKSLNLKRETVKDLNTREQSGVKGGGGLPGSVVASGDKRAGGAYGSVLS